MINKSQIIVLVIFFITATSCEKIFEFSPYQANVKEEYKNTTKKNLDIIYNLVPDTNNSFKFAVIADNHYHYNSLRTIVNDITKNPNISFVISAGDVTDMGLLKEYEIFYEIMNNLDKPYLTVIGNHDYNSNGGIIYKQMFGDYNYSFDFNNNKFIFFDDVVWESNKNPDFNWLTTQLSNNQSFKQVFVIAHIPPFSDQFDDNMENIYKSLMNNNNVQLSIHGHNHSYFYKKIYNDSVNYLVVPWPKEPRYCIITVHENLFKVELIEL